MKKTILCALAALAVSSCGEIPTEAVPADAVPVEDETLAGTEAGMQAAADGASAVCEVEYDDDLTSGNVSGTLTVTVPWRVLGWHPYSVNFTSVSRGPDGRPHELGVFSQYCRYPFRGFHGADYYCHATAGVRSYGPWQYDKATGKSSSTFLYLLGETGSTGNDVFTEISFWGAGGRHKGCNFRGRVRS